MNYYLLVYTCKDSTLKRVALEVPPNDNKFKGPIKCVTNASSRNFWREYLNDIDYYSAISISRIHSIKLYRKR